MKDCQKDTSDHLDLLERLCEINKNMKDLPIAFSTNTFYLLEKHGRHNPDFYTKVLIPAIKNKIEYIHCEGVAQTTWAAANAEIWDKELWN